MKKYIKSTIQNTGNANNLKRILFTPVAPILFACALIIVVATTSNAATYTVTNTADSGDNSLRAAVISANGTTDNDTINFNIPLNDVGCSGGICTITLTTGDLQITNPANGGALTINGTGANSLKISGNNNSRIFRILDDNGNPGSVPVTITDLTVTNGKASCVLGSGDPTGSGGGGIYNFAVLVLTNVIVTNNLADGGSCGGAGGGIYSSGGLTLNNCIVNNNTGRTVNSTTNFITYLGKGVSASSLVLNNSTVSNNLGGGISASVLTANNSIISGNSVNNGGNGGITCGSGSSINNSTVSGNTTRVIGSSPGLGATISGGNNLTISNSTVSNNTGYALQLSGTVSSSITNSTISGNTGRDVGAIFVSSGTLNLTNVTITNNRATAKPQSTLNGGATGGIKLSSGATKIVSARNSIIAGNFSTADFGNPPSATNTPDIYLIKGSDSNNNPIYGTFTSKGNNLIGDATHISEPSNTGASINWQSSDILNQSPLLEPLGNYGGATQTHALSSNSPAINAGNDCVLMINGCGANDPTTTLAADQRGATRVGAVDIGAFELNDNPNTGYRASLPSTSTSQSYNVIVAQYDDTQYPNLTYSITNGRLPNGVTLTQSSSFASGFAGDKLSGDVSRETPDAPAAIKTVALTGTPTEGGTFNFTITSSDGTNANNTNYSLNVSGPTAASATIGGRAMTANGKGIGGVRVTLTDSQGNARTTMTSPRGFYRFNDVAAGEIYIISASGKPFGFSQATQVLNITGDVDDINFIAN